MECYMFSHELHNFCTELDSSVKNNALREGCLDLSVKMTTMIDSHNGSNDADTAWVAWALCTH